MKPRSRFRGLTMFVTVGSTSFDQLIDRILQNDSIELIRSLGFTKLIIQAGNSFGIGEELSRSFEHELDIQFYDFKTSISDDISQSDVIVSHAGAGTCLETLRGGKRMLVVVNDKLMDNHQEELANQLSQDRYILKSNITNLIENIVKVCDENSNFKKFPAKRPEIFEQIFDKSLNAALHQHVS